MPSLLIAGHGFLGAALEREFAGAGWEVTTLARSGGADMRCDIGSAQQVAAVPGDYDLVIQCAATGGGGEEAYRRVYLRACRNLLERFPEGKLCFVSSTSVYAQSDHSLVTETSPAEPATATGKILRQAENAALDGGGTVVRLSGLYGPGRCHILKNFLAGTARLDGAGERVMNFVHRDDAATALRVIAGARAPESLFNVSAGSVRQRDGYAALAGHFSLPLPPPAEHAGPRKRGNSSKHVSSDLLRSLGWQPKYPDFLSLALASAE